MNISRCLAKGFEISTCAEETVVGMSCVALLLRHLWKQLLKFALHQYVWEKSPEKDLF